MHLHNSHHSRPHCCCEKLDGQIAECIQIRDDNLGSRMRIAGADYARLTSSEPYTLEVT